MSENPLRCSKCHLCNLMKTPYGVWKCPSCGNEEKLKMEDYKKPELTAKELKIRKRELTIHKIEEQILNGKISSVTKLLPYLNDSDVTIARSVQNFLISNKTYTKNPLLNSLNTADGDQLPKIIEILGLIQARELNTILLKKINDFDDETKIVIFKALGKMHSEESVIPLTELIPNQERKLKKEIIFALGEIGSNQATDSLIGLLNDSDQELIISSIDALGKIGDKYAIIPIMNLLENCSDVNFFQASARALIKIQNHYSKGTLKILLGPKKRSELQRIIKKSKFPSDSTRIQPKNNLKKVKGLHLKWNVYIDKSK